MVKQKDKKVPELSFIIPARNEQGTIQANVRACLEAAGQLGVQRDVIVVSDGSTDATDDIALETGARVIRRNTNPAKAYAVREGVLNSDAEYTFFVDADLRGLKPHHLVRVAGPVLNGKADMAIANRDNIFGRRGFGNAAERILRKELFPVDDPRLKGWNFELLINEAVGKRHGITLSFVMEGVHQRTKFDKLGWYQGTIEEAKEWSQIFFEVRHMSAAALVNYWTRIKRIKNERRETQRAIMSPAFEKINPRLTK
jgi:glycosyltransferase involved in cell wall biosynthesis